MTRIPSLNPAASALRLDAHVHLWRYDAAAMGWIPPGGPLAADHLLPELEATLAASDVGQAIVVQAQSSVEETAWLLRLAARSPRVLGVVGWCDLQAADVEQRIAALAADPHLLGLRHQVQDEAPGFLARPQVVRGVKACVDAGLAYDILVFAHHAGEAADLLEAVGPGRFVLDHGAKPPIAAGGWEPWAGAVARIARFPGVWCKLSGLVTEADPRACDARTLRPYMDHLLRCFGPERLIFGSDWPVCRLAAGHAEVLAMVRDFVAERAPGFADGVFRRHALAAYGRSAGGVAPSSS